MVSNAGDILGSLSSCVLDVGKSMKVCLFSMLDVCHVTQPDRYLSHNI